ncbi:MAG TPA: hypothetical protein VMD78_14965 [Candidatus Baltobacteraceae bacterium]|nr:hypothetical protein [Candidatus Baltobacteraceae bacterium]
MVLVLIYTVFFVVVAEFFVRRCRSIIASSKKIELPANVSEAAGVDRAGVAPDDFGKLIGLARLCPEESVGNASVYSVSAYYTLVQALGRAAHGLAPRIESWARKEQRNCAHFAAVALDRRISGTRKLLAQRVQSPF